MKSIASIKIKKINRKRNKLIYIIIVFVFIEGGLRLGSYLGGKLVFSQLTSDDSVLDWRLTPNYRQKIRGVHINSRGFRGREFIKEKGKCVRIIAIGDSCTFGAGSSSDGTTYPSLLENKLNSSNISRCYEVINAGVPGYTVKQCLLYLKNELLDLRPDIIIVYCGWNDIWTYKNPYANTANSPLLRSISRQLSKSSTFVLLQDYFINPVKFKISLLLKSNISEKSVKRIDNNLKERAIIEFKKHLDEIIELAKFYRIKAIVITIPTVIRTGMADNLRRQLDFPPAWQEGYTGFLEMYKSINQAINSLQANKDLAVLDIDKLFRNFSDKEVLELFIDTNHLNDKGYQVIADALYTNILSIF